MDIFIAFPYNWETDTFNTVFWYLTFIPNLFLCPAAEIKKDTALNTTAIIGGVSSGILLLLGIVTATVIRYRKGRPVFPMEFETLNKSLNAVL